MSKSRFGSEDQGRETTYDILHMGDREYGNDLMALAAAVYFAAHRECQFVEVHEHGGWWLGYRRDGSIWSTANDAATIRGSQPTQFSGRTARTSDLDEWRQAKGDRV